MSLDFRSAEPEDAETLASIIRETSGGLADFTLKGIIPMVSPSTLLYMQIMDENSPYFHENIIVASDAGRIEGVLLAYDWRLQRLTDMAERYMPKKRYALVKDLLQSAEKESMYINTLWISPEYRGTGLADAFIDLANEWARSSGLDRLSLHVWEENARAVKFYRRNGFEQTKRFEFPPHKLLKYTGDKLQMLKIIS